jgi:hypothetical protein
MAVDPALKRPTTLEEGREYLWLERVDPKRDPSVRPVGFVAYAACPAIIKVRREGGKVQTILRDDLFVAAG